MVTYLQSHKLSKLEKPDTTGKVRMNSHVTFSCGLEHKNMPVFTNPEKNYILLHLLGIECCVEDLPRVMSDRDEWWVRIHDISIPWWW